MMKYDPAEAPDPAEWLALDESERLELVEAHHRRARDRMPNPQAHAIFHVIVENQALDDDLPVRRAIRRLMGEGLDRHEAIHAVGSVLAAYLHDFMGEGGTSEFPTEAYHAEIENLTAESWRASFEDDDEEG